MGEYPASVHTRTTEISKERWCACADTEGKSVSEWLRDLGDAAAEVGLVFDETVPDPGRRIADVLSACAAGTATISDIRVYCMMHGLEDNQLFDKLRSVESFFQAVKYKISD
jgi:hypothetical protein